MIIGLSFVGSDLYVFQDDALLVYDESGVVDFDGTNNIAIAKRIETNPVSLDESYVKIENVHVTYSTPIDLNALVVVDGSSSSIPMKSGTNVHIEKRLPRLAKKAGLSVSFIISTVADTFSLSDFTMIIVKALRKAMNRG
jgi:hypothetical protein